MHLSIIIVNYNTKELTLNCLKSIYSSRVKTEFEVIVVDNGSKDSSGKELIKLEKKYNNFKVLLNAENLGYAKANNQGVRKANGATVLLLNSDTIVNIGTIDSLYNFSLERKDAGVIGSKLLNPDGTVQDSVFNFPTIVRTIQQYWLGEKNLLEKYAPKTKEPMEVDAVVGASFLITPQAIAKVGLLDERYFMYFEDIDYCRKVKKAGLKVFYFPMAEVIHYHGASGKKVASDANQWKRLIPSAKIYYGLVGYYLRWFIMRTGQFIYSQ